MDEPLLVRGVERLGDLREEVDRPLRLECAVLGDDLREVGALDVAHREEEDTVLLSRLVDRDDVRMVERSGDPRLPQEALTETLVLGELGRDDLERDLAAEPLLVGTVNRAHASAADERLDSVAGDRRPGRQQRARDVAHRSSVRHGHAECNIPRAPRCVTAVTFATSCPRTTRRRLPLVRS